MGRILLSVVGGYMLLVLVSSALFAGPFALLLLLVVIVVFHRARWFRAERPDELGLPAGGPDPSLGRLQAAAERLAPEFPEDPLDNPALVAVLALYAHEPEEELARVEDEFASWRRRFLDWRRRLDAGDPGPQELADVEAYVDGLRRRAEEADGLPQRALDEATRAGSLISEARLACEGLADAAAAAALSERLEAAARAHAEAWAAAGAQERRPVTALQLAGEAARLAEEVREEASLVAELPRRVERRLAGVARSLAHVDADLALAEEEVRSAAASYAPSCWHEIRGVGTAAGEAIGRASRLHAAASRAAGSGDPARLEEAARSLDEAEEALEEAARLRGAIATHLRKLEEAVVAARERILAAEKEIDRAWGGDGDGPPELLERAGELVHRAREGLGEAQPDWLTIVELADRAAELARGASSRSLATGTDRLALDRSLDAAKARAKDACDSAWAWAIVAPDAAGSASALFTEAERAYRAALAAEESLGADGAAAPSALELPIAAFVEAEAAANAFVTEVESRRGTARRPAGEQSLGHALVWDLAFRLTKGS